MPSLMRSQGTCLVEKALHMNTWEPRETSEESMWQICSAWWQEWVGKGTHKGMRSEENMWQTCSAHGDRRQKWVGKATHNGDEE